MYDKKAAVEAILFANGSPAEPDKIAQAIEMEPSQTEKLILELMDDYETQERGIRIIKLNKSYQMVSAKKFATEIRKVMDLRRNTPLSQAALEVLAVVAYNQPVRPNRWKCIRLFRFQYDCKIIRQRNLRFHFLSQL